MGWQTLGLEQNEPLPWSNVIPLDGEGTAGAMSNTARARSASKGSLCATRGADRVARRSPDCQSGSARYVRRFDLEHTFRFLKQALGWTTARHAREATETLRTLAWAAQRAPLGTGQVLPGPQEGRLNPHEDSGRGSFARGFISITKLLCLKRKLGFSGFGPALLLRLDVQRDDPPVVQQVVNHAPVPW